MTSCMDCGHDYFKVPHVCGQAPYIRLSVRASRAERAEMLTEAFALLERDQIIQPVGDGYYALVVKE